MNATEFMEDLAERLTGEKNLDPDVLDLVIDRLFGPQRERSASKALEDQLEKIAMRRANRGKA